ncbi:type III polyketide synthase [Flammeovirga sp. EKP202]|uniref:type III polyketide synthase n=1 Tax=Flammeovirga sp. EKP202 TaxID=2770592 RepID=UPI00165F622E|nr:type III polyketide synthase [Flammeovirga sp. EKP202]MBD0400862.1 type III polyketide synthase [Flammeovirga sp. EKP202]
MTYIHQIATAVPENKYDQKDILEFMQSTLSEEEHREKKLMALVSKNSGINTRHSVINNLYDYFLEGTVPDIESRMLLFDQAALKLGVEAVKKCITESQLQEITHIVTVSCTGLSAPGLEIALMKELELPSNLIRTTVNFMGCYAAFHALRIGDQICKSNPNAKVLIVDVELCSIHFQNEKDDDNILANTLFADGAAAVYMSNDDTIPSIYEIGSFFSKLLLSGEQDMAWKLSKTGFQMRLSNYIPKLIESEIANMLSDVVAQTGLGSQELQWAFHPGGVRILKAISNVLEIPKEEVQASYDVLAKHGNMSSVTILFVLLLMSKNESKGPVFSAGFGPGLTMEAMTLNKL